jgi:hypothetical protein
MIQYMLSEDKLDSLEGGAEALDLTFFGAFFAVALTLTGIGIPLYVANQRGYVFLACIALTPLSFGLSIYFFIKGWGKRRDVRKKIAKIKAESKTVLEIVATPTQQSKVTAIDPIP